MISIVVPIYNVQQYLSKCIESIFAQSFRDIETILVDDGSTDECPQICDDFARRDCRIRVIHKKNGGLSDARNAGMKVAHGEWTYFLDSDDWIHPEALQTLFGFAKKNDCDVVQGGLYYAYEDHLLYRQPSKKELKQSVLANDDAMRSLITNDRVKNFAWGKLYKTDLIRDIEFPVGKYFEDSFWQHLVIHRVKKYGIVDTPLYYYRQRENGISGNFSERNLDLLKGYEERISFIKRNYPELEKEIMLAYRKVLISVCKIGKNLGMQSYRDYENYAFEKYNFPQITCAKEFLKKNIVRIAGKFGFTQYKRIAL